MEYLLPSFFAGILTVLAPCVITLLPVILGGSVGEKNPWRPLVITLSLGASVMVFSLLLKATTAFIDIPTHVWSYIAGALILFFGITILFPGLWSAVSIKLGLHKSDKLLQKSNQKQGLIGAILLGAALGPVFSTCSPTYALILAIVLPQNFFVGLVNLLIYTVGLMIPLLLIGYGGQRIVSKFRFAANPKGFFKRALGVLLIAIGLLIVTGMDKKLETWILSTGYLGPIEIEQSLLEGVGKSNS